MALSADQIALLRLLLAGDTYERVSQVLGSSAEDVRTRAHEAAADLEADPSPEFPAGAVRARLAQLEGAVPPPAPAVAPGQPRRDRTRWALWAALAGAAAVVIVVILVVTAGGGEHPSSVGPDREDVVPIQLAPVGGSSARGSIAIVRVADQPAVDLAIRGLRPTGSGETYVLWFVGSGGRSLPVGFHAVGADGRLTGRTAIPTAAAGLLPSFEIAELTRARQAGAAAAVRRAAQAGTLPRVVGAPVLRGSLRG